MKPSVSLIHGWGMQASVWQPLRAALEATHCVLTPSLPGHGDTPHAAVEPDWVAALAARLPDHGTVVGWSLGAQLAMRIAIDHPHKVARLVLIGTTPCFVQQPDWAHALPADTVIAFNAGFSATPEQTIKRFLALQAMGDACRRELTQHLGAAVCPLDGWRLPALARGLEMLSSADLRPDIGRIDCPVRIFHGTNDALMPVAAAHWLADHIDGAQLTCFDETGHAPFISRAADFTPLLQRFLHG